MAKKNYEKKDKKYNKSNQTKKNVNKKKVNHSNVNNKVVEKVIESKVEEKLEQVVEPKQDMVVITQPLQPMKKKNKKIGKKIFFVLWFLLTVFMGYCLWYVFTHNYSQYFEVKFDVGDGTEIPNQKVVKGERVIEPEEPTNGSYIFGGWEFKGETYDFDTRVKSDMKIKAVWKDHPDYYEFMPVDIQCYDKHAYDKGKFVSVDNPSLGDKIVCFIGFETMGYDEVEEFSFDLVYNDSLYFNEVINSLDLYKIDDERYTYVYDDPMSVNEAGGYVFDVVDDGEIFIELENVEMLIDGEIFITEENPEFFAEVKPIDEDAGPIYVQYRGDSFYLQCYDKESVEKNDYEYKDEVSKGDMLVCFVGYETNVDDKVKSVEYDLNLGAGLKLVEEDLYGIGEKSTDNHYLFEFNPTSVNDIGEYVIQITDDRRVDQLYMELSDIKFVTSDDDHYSNKDARIDFILEN